MEETPTHTIRPGAEPFFFSGSTRGVLLIHGYSGSPGELRGMGEFLARRGYTVHAPLLAGHGTTPDAMHGVRWEDWLASALAGLAQLRKQCESVIVTGFSMGALLTCVIAARFPVQGIILAAPALRLVGQSLIRFADVAARVQPWYYPLARADFSKPAVREAIRGFVPDADLDDPQVVEAIRKNAKVPIGSIYELVRLQRRARRDMPHVGAPALIMQGKLDRTVYPASAEAVQRLLGSHEKQLVWFENSGHQLTREGEKEAVWRTAAEWIEHRAGEVNAKETR